MGSLCALVQHLAVLGRLRLQAEVHFGGRSQRSTNLDSLENVAFDVVLRRRWLIENHLERVLVLLKFAALSSLLVVVGSQFVGSLWTLQAGD